MKNADKKQIMKMVGRYTDGEKFNMEIIHSEDESGILDMPMFYGVVTSLDEMEEYYYKNINSVDDYWEFVETANYMKETGNSFVMGVDVVSTIK